MSEIPENDRVPLQRPPFLINLPFTQNWNVVTPYVYRYEDEQWIDAFFETGLLRLSTFAKFSTYTDEVRGDAAEGSAFCYGETVDEQAIYVYQTQGIKALVLCGTHRLDSNMQARFNRNSAFEISNTFHFAFEVSRQLRGFSNGCQGSCIYRRQKSINRKVSFNLQERMQADGVLDSQTMAEMGQILGGEELVLLKDKKYEEQAEYRLLWQVDELEGDYLDIHVPRAVQFCRRVRPDEY